MDCKYKVNIKNIQYNYKIRLAELQEKYKFNLFCTGGKYDDTEIREEIASLEEENEYLNSIVDQLPKVKVEGEYPTLDNTLQAKMKVDLKGNTHQEGTPTPETPQDIHIVSGDNTIKVCGKNLFDNSVERKNAYPNIGNQYIGQTIIYNNSNATYSYVKCAYLEANETYTISWEQKSTPVSANIRIGAIIDENDIYLQQLDTWHSSATSITFTPQNSGYLVLATDINATNIQIEKSSTASTYEAYKEKSYTINLEDIELCKIGDYKDRIYPLNGKWYLEKKIGKVVFNGSEDWSLYQKTFLTNLGTGTPNSICSSFSDKGTYWTSSDENNRGKYTMTNSADQFKCMPLTDMTLEEFKTWLSTNNVIVYYVLATPTTEEITDSTLISQLEEIKEAESYSGQTNISQVNNDAPFIINASTLYDLNNLITRVAILETE